MAFKQDRLNVSIQKYISDILQFDVRNPDIGFVTVTGVQITSDYSLAKVFVSFLGTKNPQARLEALEKSKGYIRSELAKKLTIRKCPQIIFTLDNSYEQGKRIEDILNEIGGK